MKKVIKYIKRESKFIVPILRKVWRFLSSRLLWRVVFAILLTLYTLFVFLFGFLTFGSPDRVPDEEITWGATFGHSQAEDLGLDWEETYTALLDDAGVRNFRIPIYWDELEPHDGVFEFSKWDKQLDMLAERGGKAILTVGFKLPRWPECRFPGWLDVPENLSRDNGFSKELFEMLRVVVTRYRDHDAVYAWQVENEPLLTFGVCPEANKDLLDAEIDLVRALDPTRPVIITDTGEFSAWYEAGKRADIVGSTLFRVIHNPRIGFVEYWFINPNYYARKAQILKWWRPDTEVIISELQAEPWVTGNPISIHPIEEQYRTMSPEKFRENIEFAKSTGFDTFYLWGSEWWYWLKEQGHDEVWNEVKGLF